MFDIPLLISLFYFFNFIVETWIKRIQELIKIYKLTYLNS